MDKFYEDNMNYGDEENVADIGFRLVDFTNCKFYILNESGYIPRSLGCTNCGGLIPRSYEAGGKRPCGV